MVSPFKIGLVGCGTLGSAVAERLLENKIKVGNKKIELVKIYTRHPQGPKSAPLFYSHPQIFVDDLNSIVLDPEIEAVIETVGGIDFAETVIKASLMAGKHVVTANKALLAAKPYLFSLASEQRLWLKFEAAVAGEIPIIRILDNCFKGDEISAIWGILNGTTNFLLSKMLLERKSFPRVLQEAQALGLAEADSSEDIEGRDSLNKLVLLIRQAFGLEVAPEVAPDAIYTQGIERITLKDMEYAEFLKKTIKLIAYAGIVSKGKRKELTAHIFPTLIDSEDPLAKISDATNSVKISLKYGQDVFFSGPGAGGPETANSVIDDLREVAKNSKNKPVKDKVGRASIEPFGDCAFQHTLRFTVRDQPGIVGAVGQILGQFGISIYSIVQVPFSVKESERLTFLITLHPCREIKLQQALQKINQLPFNREPVLVLRSIIPAT